MIAGRRGDRWSVGSKAHFDQSPALGIPALGFGPPAAGVVGAIVKPHGHVLGRHRPTAGRALLGTLGQWMDPLVATGEVGLMKTLAEPVGQFFAVTLAIPHRSTLVDWRG